MRVTNGMITNQVMFNTQRALKRYVNLQSNMSSGRRINQPSDDPLGTLRDLNYRTELAKIDQFQKNISTGQNWLKTYDNSLAEIKDFISTAKEVAVAMSNGTYDATARDASATEIESIFKQIIQTGNSQLEDRQIYAGFLTQTTPLMVGTNGVVYNGDTGAMEFEVESQLRMQINLNGSDVFLKQLSTLGEDADLNVGMRSTILLSALHNGSGVDLTPGTFTVTDKNLGTSVTIDVSAATTLQDALTAINAQLTAAGMTNLSISHKPGENALSIDTTATGQIAPVTSLGNLRNGAGIDLSSGRLRVTDGAGIDVSVDMSGALTVNDVITKFNNAMTAAGVANVTMGINAAGTGFGILDTNGIPLGLSIENYPNETAIASVLGIAGAVGTELVGAALEPQPALEIAETTGTIAQDLGLKGVYTTDKTGNDLDPRLTATALLADIRAGAGFSRGRMVMWQGTSNATIDLSDPTLVTVQDLLDRINSTGLNITASINESGRGIQIANNDSNMSFTIEDSGTGHSSKDLGVYGSSDMMGSLLSLVNALRDDDQEGAGLLLQNMDDSIQHLLNMRSTVGARTNRLESIDSRMTNQKLSFTKLLSDVEDADLTELATELATRENSYQAALLASAKLLQPSLLDFID